MTILAELDPPPAHPTDPQPQHCCLDKGYDNPTGHAAAASHGFTPHVRRIGEEKLGEKQR